MAKAGPSKPAKRTRAEKKAARAAKWQSRRDTWRAVGQAFKLTRKNDPRFIPYLVIFGVGARLTPHVLAPNGARRMALYLSPITIGDGALIGAYSVLLPGCEVAQGEVTPPFRAIHAFSRFANGRRIRVSRKEQGSC